MLTDRFLAMLIKFLRGEYDPQEFSFDFPAEVGAEYNMIEAENPEVAEIFDELCYDCGFFNPDEVDRKYTFGIEVFREKAQNAYNEALKLTIEQKKAV